VRLWLRDPPHFRHRAHRRDGAPQGRRQWQRRILCRTLGKPVITPANTYYTVQILDSNGNVSPDERLSSAAAPFNPPPAPIIIPNPVLLNPAGVQIIAGGITIQGNLVVTGTITNGGIVPVAFSANPAFNAVLGNVFEMTLTGNVVGSTIAGTFGGQLITFILIQDAVGGRTFVYPAQVKNTTAIDATANAINVQSFVARANGNLYPIAPMTIS
jgi:hypothetical protein